LIGDTAAAGRIPLSVVTAYIGLGSNLGDSLHVVHQGWVALGLIPGISLVNLSHPYQTEPVDMVSDNWFVNAVGEVQTSLAPKELLQNLLLVEAQFGRRRDPSVTGYRDRVLDLDLLLYGQMVINEQGLRVPHPFLPERHFVLLPLCELAADARHPVIGETMGELLQTLIAKGKGPVVEKLQWPELLNRA